MENASANDKKAKPTWSVIMLTVAGIGYIVLGIVLAYIYATSEAQREAITAIGLFATVAGLGFVALDLAARKQEEARRRDQSR